MKTFYPIAFPVSDIGEALAWYGCDIDAELVHQAIDLALLDVGGTTLALAFVLADSQSAYAGGERETAKMIGFSTPHQDDAAPIRADHLSQRSMKTIETEARR